MKLFRKSDKLLHNTENDFRSVKGETESKLIREMDRERDRTASRTNRWLAERVRHRTDHRSRPGRYSDYSRSGPDVRRVDTAVPVKSASTCPSSMQDWSPWCSRTTDPSSDPCCPGTARSVLASCPDRSPTYPSQFTNADYCSTYRLQWVSE